MSTDLFTQLKILHLYSMAEAWSELRADASFMADAHNLILVGGTGTGKTHLATALGVTAIH